MSREAERKYEGDVFYDVWRAGGNPDRINMDRVDDHYGAGDDQEAATRDELQHQRPAPDTEYDQEQEP